MFKDIDGVRITFEHYRVPLKGMPPCRWSRKNKWSDKGLNDNHIEPEPHGGRTLCIIWVQGDKPEDDQMFAGEAICGKKETYSYKIGRDIAFGRAVKKLEGEK